MQKLQKIRHYLRAGDLHGLACESVNYVDWRLRTTFGVEIDVAGRYLDTRIRYGIGKQAQDGEDVILKRLLKNHPCPYLVDVGAHDGRSWSNSRVFMLRGWHGMLIEPLPKAFAQLASVYANHARAMCLNLACTDHKGEQALYIGADGDTGMGSTLCEDDNAWFGQTRSAESIMVNTDTLTNLLDGANWPQEFGLLLIDAEGMDYEVLRGLDFSRYRPAVIVTEEYKVNPAKHQAKYELLQAHRYRLLQVTADGTNSIWLAPSFAVET